MRKFIYTLILVSVQLTALAQTVNVHFKNGQQIRYNADNVDYVDFSEKAEEPTTTAGNIVDLGLSVYWASCNLGAEKPEEYGNYYAWGETKPKNKYAKDNYSYYNKNTTEYIDIGEDISGTSYDAATVNLGEDWRMPTKDEINELINKCKWEWTQIANINGYRVTGPNGNSIFLPAAGYHSYMGQDYLYDLNKSISYWTSISYTNQALQLHGSISNIKVYSYHREVGNSIRPVTSNPDAGSDNTDHSQDYLVTNKVSASFSGGSISSINGIIQSGSQLNVCFNNGSSKSIILVKIQLGDVATGSEGNNMLDEEVEVAAGEIKEYTVSVGASGITKPVIRFTYRYNKKDYVAEAIWDY